MTPPATESPQSDPASTLNSDKSKMESGVAIAPKSRTATIPSLLLKSSLILGLAMLWVLLSAKAVR
ncbi:MAG TPA: hypothetical protein V6D07_16015 [Trichocoleus sp.]